MSDQEPEEGEKDSYWAALLAGGILGGGVAYHYAREAFQRWKIGGEPAAMAVAVVNAARALCTPVAPYDYVGAGDPRWDDEILGGNLGPDHWQFYQTWLDKEKTRSGGTSCAIVVDAILEHAGVSTWKSPITGKMGSLLLNKNPPTGVGFMDGAWGDRLVSGGDACGIRVQNPDIQPGDVYYIRRDNDVRKWHVGACLERHGSNLVTVDGGQKDPKGAQCVRIMERTLRGKILAGKFGEGEVLWRLSFPR